MSGDRSRPNPPPVASILVPPRSPHHSLTRPRSARTLPPLEATPSLRRSAPVLNTAPGLDNDPTEALKARIRALEEIHSASAREIAERDRQIAALEADIEAATTPRIRELEIECAVLRARLSVAEMKLAGGSPSFGPSRAASPNLPRLPFLFEDLEDRVKELNAIAGDGRVRVGARKRLEATAVELAIYSNGLMLGGGPFRRYEDDSAAALLRDILDGYFPWELKERYPDGGKDIWHLLQLVIEEVAIALKDCREKTIDEPYFAFSGRGRQLSSPPDPKPVVTDSQRTSLTLTTEESEMVPGVSRVQSNPQALSLTQSQDHLKTNDDGAKDLSDPHLPHLLYTKMGFSPKESPPKSASGSRLRIRAPSRTADLHLHNVPPTTSLRTLRELLLRFIPGSREWDLRVPLSASSVIGNQATLLELGMDVNGCLLVVDRS